jgi:hypothetical protein
MKDNQSEMHRSVTKKDILIAIVVCCVGLVIAIHFLGGSDSKTPEEIKKERLENQFSAWDGSHRGLTNYIKNAMNDPGSYEHVETVYWDRKDHLIVKATFRGKNAFGGVVKNSVKAKVDLAGNVLEVIETQP